MTAAPLTSKLISTKDCLFVQPQVSLNPYREDLEDMCKFAKQMSTLCEFVNDGKASQIKKEINACIREQREIEDDAFGCDPNLIRLWKLVKSIKEDCLFLCRNNGPAAYIKQDRIDAEGYTMTNEFGMFKLVQREVFSYHNFTSGRFQCASA